MPRRHKSRAAGPANPRFVARTLDSSDSQSTDRVATVSFAPMSRLYFYSKVILAWVLLLFLVLMFVSTWTSRGKPGIFLAWLALMIFVVTSAIAHVRRVRLVNGTVNGAALANRHRRQIELPMGPDQAFDVVDAAIRELPNVEDVQSTRANLQVFAKVRRVYPYA
jgi:hypothetical protein